jgi:hypothetical protein
MNLAETPDGQALKLLRRRSSACLYISMPLRKAGRGRP